MAAPSLLESPTQHVADVLARICGEYVAMPGLKLTAPQARRLWNLDDATCEAALATLVKAKFLSCTLEGLFVLATTSRLDHNLRRDSGTSASFVPPRARRRSPVATSLGDPRLPRKSA
jgi:hypothetical protein